MRQAKIAVAGATGRLGRHVVEVLGAEGHEVVPIARSADVDRAHLIDEHVSPGSVQVDFRAEDRGLRGSGHRGDDKRGEQDPVALDRDRVPGAALLMPGGVLGGPQPVQVTTH